MRTADEIRAILRANLGYLERSAAGYDQGHTDEAIRIAVAVRTMVHDLKGDSLLRQLGVYDQITLLSTCDVFNPKVLVVMGGGLSAARMQFRDGRLVATITVPMLGSWPHKHHWLSVAKWWEEAYQPMHAITRKSLVLDAANRDGGTHVGALRREYASLKTGLFGGVLQCGTEPEKPWQVPNQHLSDLRQVAFELLNSPDLAAAAGL